MFHSDRTMIDDAIRGARNKLRSLKRQNKITKIYDDEIKRTRRRLSKYGALKEVE